MTNWFLAQTFDDCTDRDCAIAAYRRNNEMVRDLVPAERLLVFQVANGWAPLCEFLELPVPAMKFPHRHPRKEFWEHFGGEPEWLRGFSSLELLTCASRMELPSSFVPKSPDDLRLGKFESKAFRL